MSPATAQPQPITRSPPISNEPPAKRSASTFISSRRRPISSAIPTIPRHFTAPEIPQIKSEHQTSTPSLPPTSHRAPIGLSLSDDDPPTYISLSSDSASPEALQIQNPTHSPNKRITPERPGEGPAIREHRPSVTSPMETIDQLYEYFPLSLDDWMPPVDAIYRPHVVHHLKVVNASGAQSQEAGVRAGFTAGRGKPKRYFSGGDD